MQAIEGARGARSRGGALLLLAAAGSASGQAILGFGGGLDALRGPAVVEIEDALPPLVRRFAPVLRQDTAGGGDQDWITAVDFDGDWIGTNNWQSQGETREGRRRFPHRATVYASSVETRSHAFLVYAWFHPRDWSEGLLQGQGFRSFLSKVTFGKVPDSAHENDLEGALVVVEKGPDPRVVLVETVYHRVYLKYPLDEGLRLKRGEARPGLRLHEARPVLMIQSHGHGVEAWDGEAFPGRHDDGVVYLPGDRAGDPEDHPEVGRDALFEADRGGRVRQVPYRLVPLRTTLWARAQGGESALWGEATRYPGYHPGLLGSKFRGDDYGKNAANAPWGWSDQDSDVPAGALVFDPAGMVAAQFEVPPGFSRQYTRHPFRAGGVGEAD